MIAFIVLLSIMLGILIFRMYRTVKYYNEAQASTEPEEKEIARTNFIIHLIFCILLSAFTVATVYWFVQQM